MVDERECFTEEGMLVLKGERCSPSRHGGTRARISSVSEARKTGRAQGIREQ